ncbi:hypothetical protein F4775DRAFT_592103 [Biscogniauxia sp. FL1348]|nr:hypothetical protein F4775DRAFT_592103 [Biscogniauxia sp. FL1348]
MATTEDACGLGGTLRQRRRRRDLGTCASPSPLWAATPMGNIVLFADTGYLVVGLDYFRGAACAQRPCARTLFRRTPVWKHRKNRHDASDPDLDYGAWKRKYVACAGAKVLGWVAVGKERYGKPDARYACVGWLNGWL